MKILATKRIKKKVKAFKIINKIIQDATAMEITFPDVLDNDNVTIGAMAEIDGKPASGEFVMPDGRVFVFKAGRLSKIIAEEVLALNYRPSRVSKHAFEIGTAILKRTKALATNKPAKRVKKANPMLTSKSSGTATQIDRTAGAKAWLKNKRKKRNNK